MLKFVLVFILTLSCNSKVLAHEFYFAYAELTYNELAKRFEGTIIFTTHDLEKALEPKGSLMGKLESSDESSPIRTILENYINQHLQITYGCALDSNAIDAICKSKFILEGIVPHLNGTVECFISSPSTAFYPPLSAQFSALTEVFAGQQNKLTFIYRQEKQTLNFIPGKLIQNIPLKL